MALPPDWKEQMQDLSPAELAAEIEREETLLGEHYQSLYDADQRLTDTEQQLAEEAQREESRRYLDRSATIRRLEQRRRDRQGRIDDLTGKATSFQRRALDPYTPLTYKIISLEVAADLLRTVRALEGWQTRERRSLAAYRGWQTREIPQTERLRQLLEERNTWAKETQRIAASIKIEEAQIAYKKSIIPPIALTRVGLALYLIIEAGSHEYPREPGKYYTYYKPHYRKARNRVSYPKGRFQSILECDSFIDAKTGEIQLGVDPLKTLLPILRAEVADEFIEEFSLKALDPDTLTLGGVNIVPGEEEIGKPPYKHYIARTDEETGKEWKTTVKAYLMTDSQYLTLTRNMKEYLEALEAMG